MKKNDLIMLAAIGAGGYVLYNWLKSSGNWDKWFGAGSDPTTNVNAAGAGTTTAIVDPAYAAYLAAQQQLAAQGQNSVPSVYRQTPIPVETTPAIAAGTRDGESTYTWTSHDPAPPAADPTRVAMLEAAAAGNPWAVNGLMNADQWNYYRNALFPPDLTPAQFGQAFPSDVPWRNDLMTAQQFMTQLASSGLGDIVGAVPKVKSLSFAGPKSAFGGAFRPVSRYKGNYGPNVN